jgi:hypothetical protein
MLGDIPWRNSSRLMYCDDVVESNVKFEKDDDDYIKVIYHEVGKEGSL